MESLAVMGIVASLAQLVSNTISLARVLTEFYQAFDDAPAELGRLMTKVLLVRNSLASLGNLSNTLDENDILPPELKTLLKSSMDTVSEAVKSTQATFQYTGGKKRSSRLRWALIERHKMDKLLGTLERASDGLSFVLEILNIQISLVSHSSLKEVLSTSMIIVERLETAPQGTMSTPALPSSSTTSEDQHDNNQHTREGTVVEKAGFEPLIIPRDSWLQWLGFFGSIGFRAAGKRRTTSTQLGFRFPSWIKRKALTVELITH